MVVLIREMKGKWDDMILGKGVCICPACVGCGPEYRMVRRKVLVLTASNQSVVGRKLRLALCRSVPVTFFGDIGNILWICPADQHYGCLSDAQAFSFSLSLYPPVSGTTKNKLSAKAQSDVTKPQHNIHPELPICSALRLSFGPKLPTNLE